MRNKLCSHIICGGPVPSRSILADIRRGREYDPARGVPVGVIVETIQHAAWGYAYRAIGFEPCRGILGRSHAE